MKTILVSIIMGSDSDLEVMKEAGKVLKEFDVPFEITIVSAHRTPKRLFEFSENAHKRGVKVIIAGAGGAQLIYPEWLLQFLHCQLLVFL